MEWSELNAPQDSVAVLRGLLDSVPTYSLALTRDERAALEAAIASLQASPGAAAVGDVGVLAIDLLRDVSKDENEDMLHDDLRERIRNYFTRLEAALATPSAPVGVDGFSPQEVTQWLRLTLRSGVAARNDNVIGDFRDERTAHLVGSLLMALDKNDHPEYRDYTLDYATDATPAVSVGDAVRAAIEAIPSGYFNFLGEHTQYENRTAVADLVVAAIASKGDSNG